MVFVETSFPRGGTIKKDSSVKFNSKIPQLFGAVSAKKRKIKKVFKKRNKNGEEIVDITKYRKTEHKDSDENDVLGGILNTNIVQIEGILLMGCIRDVHSTYLKVQLPRNIQGTLSATEISDAYTKQVESLVSSGEMPENFKSLTELYKVGQLLTVKVLNITDTKIELTTNPKLLHSDLVHNKFYNGFIFNGAIEEIEDHGLIINTGVKHLRAFYPMKDKTKCYAVGQIISCEVERVESAKSETTIIVGPSRKNKKELTTNDANVSLEMVLPQTYVKFTITKINKTVVYGTICDGAYEAAVAEHHLTVPLKRPSDLIPGQEFTARVICIAPLTKMVFVTLNLNKIHTLNSHGMIKIGTILKSAEIMNVSMKKIELKLDDHSKGILIRPTKSYAAGQKAKIKVVGYNIFDRIYFCSDDERFLKENPYALEKLKINDKVDFIVSRFTENTVVGFVGFAGNVTGFIHKYDIAEKDIKEQDILKAKIVSISNKLIFLTTRAEFMNDDKVKILQSWDDAVVGESYTGVVCKELSNTFLIRFFNNVVGSIVKNEKAPLKIGKIKYFEVFKKEEGQLFLRLPTDAEYKQSTDLQTGKIIKVKTLSCLPTGLQVELPDSSRSFISNLNFSLNLELSQLLCNTLEEGKSFKCIYLGNNMLSVRDIAYFEKHPPKTYGSIVPGDILRAFVKDVTEDRVELISPILYHYKKSIFVYKKSLGPDVDTSNFLPGRVIHLKVLRKAKYLRCSPDLLDVWNYDFDFSMEMFMKYLKDYDILKKRLEFRKNVLAKYNIGDRVTGVVLEFDRVQRQVKVSLENGITGLISKGNYKGFPEKGNEIECTVLWIDLVKKYLDLTSKHDSINLSNENNDTIDIEEKVSLNCEILLVKDDIILVKPKIKNSSIIFIPKFIHPNDFSCIIKAYLFSSQCKVFRLQKFSEYYIGMFVNFYNKMVKPIQNIIENNKKRQMNAIIESENNVDNTKSKKRKLDSEQKIRNSQHDCEDGSEDVTMKDKTEHNIEDEVSDDENKENGIEEDDDEDDDDDDDVADDDEENESDDSDEVDDEENDDDDDDDDNDEDEDEDDDEDHEDEDNENDDDNDDANSESS